MNKENNDMNDNDQNELEDLRAEVAAWRGRFGADVAAVGYPDPSRIRELERVVQGQRVELAAARRAAQYWRTQAEEAGR